MFGIRPKSNTESGNIVDLGTHTGHLQEGNVAGQFKFVTEENMTIQQPGLAATFDTADIKPGNDTENAKKWGDNRTVQGQVTYDPDTRIATIGKLEIVY